MLEFIFNKILLMSLAGGIVGIVLLIISGITKKCFTHRWNYYIFVVPLTLLIIPFSFGIKIQPTKAVQIPAPITQTQQVVNVVPVILDEDVQIPRTQHQVQTKVQPTPKQQTVNFNWDIARKILPFLWLGLFLLLLLYKMIIQIKFRYSLNRIAIAPLDEQLNLFNTMKHGKNVKLKMFADSGTPFITGIFKPTIYVPNTAMTDYEFCMVLKHELTHIERHDLLYKWLIDLITNIHFFNPVVYLIKNKVRKLCELSCDETVTKNMDMTERKDYGRSILNLMKQNNIRLQSSIALCESEKNIENRLEIIMKNKKSSKFTAILSSVLAAIIGLSSVVFANEIVSDTGIKNQIIVSYNGVVAELKNKPFIENGEMYLPLRETLIACGVEDSAIIWQDAGNILTEFPLSDYKAEAGGNIYTRKMLAMHLDIDICELTFVSDSTETKTLTHSPIMRNDTTYVPIGVLLRIKNYYQVDENRNPVRFGFLDGLKVEKYDSDGKKDIMITPQIFYTLDNCFDPKTYYEPNEKVLIGTPAQQEEYGHYNPTDEVRNGKLIKRIVVDDLGEVVAVVPIENQLHETLNVEGITFVGINGWERAFLGGAIMTNTDENGEPIGEPIRTGIMVCEGFVTENGYKLEQTAYIPVEYQIKSGNENEPNTFRRHPRDMLKSDEMFWAVPSSNTVTAPFGERIHPVTKEIAIHNGIDISAPMGAKVCAIMDGKVLEVGYDEEDGNYVILEHSNGITSKYATLNEIQVHNEQTVTQRDTIGSVGVSGRSTGPHLHLEIAINGTPVDPLKYDYTN